MFKLISYNDLIPGNKYKIGDYIGFFVKNHWLNLDIYHITLDDLHLVFIDLKHRYTYFSHYCEFYQFVSQNPQWKMERRSVNMIVRKLLGDQHFEW
jgi:hypothetical protein